MARNLAIDALKVVLAIMVVGIHCHLFLDVNTFLNSITANGIFRIAVPIFLLINGYYFYSVNTKDLLIRWSSRVAVLYVFWMIVFSPFWLSISNSYTSSIIGAMKTIAFGYHHLWYLSAMLLAGIVVFSLRDKVKIMIVLSCTLYIIGCLLQYLADYNVNILGIKFAELPLIARRNFLFVAIPFFYCGFMLNKLKVSISNISPLILTSLLFFTEITIRYISSDVKIGFDNQIMSIPVAVCVFLYLLGKKSTINSRALSDLSSSIYFTHPLIISLLIYLGIESSIYLFIATTISTYMISLLLCKSSIYHKVI